MQSRLRYLTLILLLSAFLTFYITIPVITPINTVNKHFNPKSGIKEIIAYSLKKQIEIESEEVTCQELSKSEQLMEKQQLWSQVPNTELNVFNIYHDDRLKPFHYLRLIGMIKGLWNETLYCQIKIADNVYHITKAVRTNIWSKEWYTEDEESFNPVLISCYIPSNYIPQSLSLSIKPCILSKKSFRVIVPRKTKDLDYSNFTMTVCVKPLNFIEDISKKLLQWIEINKILGADRFEFYVDKVHKNVNKLLKFYSRTFKRSFSIKYYRNVEDFTPQSVNGNESNLVGVKDVLKHDNYWDIKHNSNYRSVEATALLQTKTNHSVSWRIKNERHKFNRATLKTSATNTVNDYEVFSRNIWQKRRNEIITYNDCMYRNLQTSHFIIPVDIDEIIVPKKFYTWKDSLRHVFKLTPDLQEQFASFSVRNAYFLKEFSKEVRHSNVFFFDYVKRSQFSDEGPGLSIHCMQVHKEAIDKVPNSMPNRSNIEIEIYGMEGIPAADLKEHERHKQGGPDSDDDEPLPKRPKPEGLLGTAPGTMSSPGLVPGLMPPTLHHGMPPGMQMSHILGPMGHLGHHFLPPGMQMMPPHLAMMQAQTSPVKPLFPSAVPVSSPGAPVVGADFKPISAGATISAPPTTNSTPSGSSSSDTSKVATIATTGAASKIIHPPEDISLEEIRARQSRYQRNIPDKEDMANTSTSASEQLALAVSAAQQAAVNQAKQDALNHAAMLQRFQRPTGPPVMTMQATPVSMPLVMRPMIPGPPTFVGANLMRPPPLGMPPGLIGVPPGVVYGAPVLPGGHMLTPMMQPRYR
ncbi:hypothetical protein RN001_013609 [Aquatica leii]|uniref:Glycosyltransferase family 92 protein n=1 Tax=Aquatica leii TaxID=1421715 RepID=A0AAN7PQU9_9COLE|nr:hypothetical protein RN001_013609 [Aquatica leii]